MTNRSSYAKFEVNAPNIWGGSEIQPMPGREVSEAWIKEYDRVTDGAFKAYTNQQRYMASTTEEYFIQEAPFSLWDTAWAIASHVDQEDDEDENGRFTIEERDAMMECWIYHEDFPIGDRVTFWGSCAFDSNMSAAFVECHGVIPGGENDPESSNIPWQVLFC